MGDCTTRPTLTHAKPNPTPTTMACLSLPSFRAPSFLTADFRHPFSLPPPSLMDGVSPLKLPLQSPLPSPLLVLPHYPRMASLPVLLPCLLLLLAASPALSTNPEGEALHAWRTRLTDPTNVLQSWDPTLVNPCTWFHVTCDSQNRVIRLDLGNSNISGSIGPELGGLERLQYLELYRNNFQGKIPAELGNLKSLISMDLYGNQLQGEIPKSFAKLKSLRFLRLNNNRLSGSIPRELVFLSNLKVLDLSNNDLCGTIPIDGPFANFPLQSFDNNSRLNGPELQGLVPYDIGC